MGREKNEFMQEERRRKEAERIAEDLFHNEKVKFNVGSNSMIKKQLGLSCTPIRWTDILCSYLFQLKNATGKPRSRSKK